MAVPAAPATAHFRSNLLQRPWRDFIVYMSLYTRPDLIAWARVFGTLGHVIDHWTIGDERRAGLTSCSARVCSPRRRAQHGQRKGNPDEMQSRQITAADRAH